MKTPFSRRRSRVPAPLLGSPPIVIPPCDGVPELVDEDATVLIPIAELERQRDVGRPARSQRPTLEMPPEAIEALRLASVKRTRDLQRMESTTRRDRKPKR